MKKIYTTYDIAKLCNVDISTVINWIDSDKLRAYKTPGGHRRIREENFIQFLKSYGLPIPRGLGETRISALVVDDDLASREIVKDCLNASCPEIDLIEASDGFTAGKLLAEKHPSLVILDIKLPGLDGYGVCKLIKSDRRLQHTRILALTAYHAVETEKMIRDAGADEYLSKPFEINELIDRVKKLFP